MAPDFKTEGPEMRWCFWQKWEYWRHSCFEAKMCLLLRVLSANNGSTSNKWSGRCSRKSFIRNRASHTFTLLFFKDYLFILDRGEGREKERERNINVWLPHMPPTGDLTWPATQAHALTGNRTGNPLVHRLVLNPLSHTSQGTFTFYSCVPEHITSINAKPK